jgi:steroid delta-isomerase-like uncharacterized protein
MATSSVQSAALRLGASGISRANVHGPAAARRPISSSSTGVEAVRFATTRMRVGCVALAKPRTLREGARRLYAQPPGVVTFRARRVSRRETHETSIRGGATSTTQHASNKATFKRFHDAINTGDTELISKTIDEIVEPDVLIRTPLPVQATGAQALNEVFARLHRAFPDLHVTVEDLIAEGDKVVGRNSVTGTHQGEYMGLPPTGRSLAYNEIFIFRFVNGRIAETWGVVDVFSQMKQLGVIRA